MGGTTEPIIAALNESYTENAKLSEAVKIAVDALKAGGNGSDSRSLGPSTLEVAILDANRPRRAFRRITGAALEAMLPERRVDFGGVARPRGPATAETAHRSRIAAEIAISPQARRFFPRVPVDAEAPPVNYVLRKARCVA